MKRTLYIVQAFAVGTDDRTPGDRLLVVYAGVSAVQSRKLFTRCVEDGDIESATVFTLDGEDYAALQGMWLSDKVMHLPGTKEWVPYKNAMQDTVERCKGCFNKTRREIRHGTNER